MNVIGIFLFFCAIGWCIYQFGLWVYNMATKSVLVKCPHCGGYVQRTVITCPHCKKVVI